jgi:hypothetical protein
MFEDLKLVRYVATARCGLLGYFVLNEYLNIVFHLQLKFITPSLSSPLPTPMGLF